MDGVVNVRKTDGPTSHDVVYAVRKLFGQKRVGHAGTLDPMATGVLVVCLGKATRIVEYLMGGAKEYRARLVLGLSTDTQDSTGATTAGHDASAVTEEALRKTNVQFVGEIEQVPPMVSALKHQGKPLYKLAREGKTIERAPRLISVYSIDLLSFTPGERAEAEIVVKCSSGTYIRTLCADIGDALGCGGHMAMLERTQVGEFRVSDAHTVEELQQAKLAGRLDDYVIDTGNALLTMPAVELSESSLRDVMHGIAVESVTDAADGETVRMVTEDGRLVAIGIVRLLGNGTTLVMPKKVLAELDALEVS